MPMLVVQKGASETDMMSSKFPTTSEDQKRLLQSFYDLPPKDKAMLYKAVEHLNWLAILWDLEKLSPDSMPSIQEKRHILLAISCCKYYGLTSCRKGIIKPLQFTS